MSGEISLWNKSAGREWIPRHLWRCNLSNALVMSCADNHKRIWVKVWKHTGTSDKHRYGSLDPSEFWPQLEPIIAIILIQFDWSSGGFRRGGLGDKGQILVKYLEWTVLWILGPPTPTPPLSPAPRTHPSCLSPGEVRSVDYKVTKENSDGSGLSCGWCVAGTILHCLSATCMKFLIILLHYLTEVKFMPPKQNGIKWLESFLTMCQRKTGNACHH